MQACIAPLCSSGRRLESWSVQSMININICNNHLASSLESCSYSIEAIPTQQLAQSKCTTNGSFVYDWLDIVPTLKCKAPLKLSHNHANAVLGAVLYNRYSIIMTTAIITVAEYNPFNTALLTSSAQTGNQPLTFD